MEEWRDIPGLEGYYQASSLGQIRSVDREYEIPATHRSKSYRRMRYGRILKPAVVSTDRTIYGYLQVTLWKDGVQYTGLVHQFVGLAFLGPCPGGMYVCHKNGKGLDCAVDNLYHGTPKQNSDDALTHGTRARGETHGATDLSEEDVAYIRAMKGRVSQQKLGEQFGVQQPAISRIQSGKRWGHI